MSKVIKHLDHRKVCSSNNNNVSKEKLLENLLKVMNDQTNVYIDK